MTNIVLLGAGGKMGLRLAANLKGSRFHVDHVEISEAGRARLEKSLGIKVVDQSAVLPDADIVLMAVPDRLIGKIALSLYTSIYVAEIVRGAVQAVPRGQAEAARSTGLTALMYFAYCYPVLRLAETKFGGVRLSS